MRLGVAEVVCMASDCCLGLWRWVCAHASGAD